MIGLEPIRLSATDLESVSSAIPTHPHVGRLMVPAVQFYLLCCSFIFTSHKYFIKTKLRCEQQPPTVRLLTCSFSSVNRFFLSQKKLIQGKVRIVETFMLF